MSLPEGAALGHNFSSPVRRSQQKTEKATAPSPSSSLCRYRTQALHSLNRGRVFYLRGGGMVSSVVTSGTRSGASVFSGSALRVPEAKRGRVPCDGAEEIYAAPHPEHTGQWRTPPLQPKPKKSNTKALSSKAKGFICARYWDRTSDLFRVREARYRCANRAHKTVVLLRGEDGIRTRVHGFAGRCLTTRPPHRIRSTRERVRTLGVLTSG